MNLHGVQWVGENFIRDTNRLFRYPWPLGIIMEHCAEALPYWRDFKRKHVHWTGTKIVLREDEC